MSITAEPNTPPLTVHITRSRALARIELDRPRALNALNDAMRTEIAAAMPRFVREPEVYAVTITARGGRAFCAGGDLRELTALATADIAAARKSLAFEYGLVWFLECFAKPTVSLIDGLVVGSGVGLTQFGTHRVAGPGYAFAMPETMVGFFPDVGLAHTFARMPDGIGLYLGLTGRTIGRADAYRLGLVTHCIDAGEFAAIEAGLADADTVDPLLDERHVDPGPGELAAHREVLADAFGSAESMQAVMGRLEAWVARGGASRDFAQGLLADLAARSPMALEVTFRHIRRAAKLDLRGVLEQDYRIAARMVAPGSDLHEGTRALLIDKDRNPQWRPARLGDVATAAVEAYFAPLPEGYLGLPSRAAMQALR